MALALAERIGGEIISVDSMQVYRGMDIGTAKPGPEELRRAPHHLIDVAGLEERFDAARFVQLAGRAVAEIQSRGRVPIFCGGTGLYFKAFCEGLGDAPPADAALRAELENRPLAELLAELEKTDPATFQRIDRQNARRVIRAVEVIRLTGKPFSLQRAAWSRGQEPSEVGTPRCGVRTAQRAVPTQENGEFYPAPTVWNGAKAGEAGRLFGLTRPAGELRERIARRVEEMFARGLVAETQSLLARGLEQNPTAMQALGYRAIRM